MGQIHQPHQNWVIYDFCLVKALKIPVDNIFHFQPMWTQSSYRPSLRVLIGPVSVFYTWSSIGVLGFQKVGAQPYYWGSSYLCLNSRVASPSFRCTLTSLSCQACEWITSKFLGALASSTNQDAIMLSFVLSCMRRSESWLNITKKAKRAVSRFGAIVEKLNLACTHKSKCY